MLTELKVRSAKPARKAYKLYDGGNLYLMVLPTGTKTWRFDYRFGGKRKTLVIGQYPIVSLKEARIKRDLAKRLLLEGKDPHEAFRQRGVGTTFEEVAERWFRANESRWKPEHKRTIRFRLDRYILPAFGSKDIREIRRGEVLEMLENIKSAGRYETARRVNMIVNNIFTYAYDLEITDRIPSHRLSKYLEGGPKRHFPAILDPQKVGKLMLDIENYSGDFTVRCAMKLLALTFVRPGELRLARWEEFNLKDAIWDIPAERMKTGRPHRVFLSRQAVEVLEALAGVYTMNGYVFKGKKADSPISNATLNKALKVMGYDTRTEMTAHGFRAMARTLIHERLGYSPEIIEHQLAHKVPDPLGEAYNRTRFWEQRKKMMQDWADYLDELKRQASGQQ